MDVGKKNPSVEKVEPFHKNQSLSQGYFEENKFSIDQNSEFRYRAFTKSSLEILSEVAVLQTIV